MMLYFLVERSQACLDLLDTCDTVGCNFSESPYPHFSGNFWWATTEYIRTLSTTRLLEKMDAEWWIHSGSPTYDCLHKSGKDHFNEAYPSGNYHV